MIVTLESCFASVHHFQFQISCLTGASRGAISFPFHRRRSKTEEIDLFLANSLEGMQPRWYTTLPFRLFIFSYMQSQGSEHSFNSGKQRHVNTPVLPNSIVLNSAIIPRVGV